MPLNEASVKADEKTKADPFYSETNMTHLRRGIEQLNAGRGRYDIITLTSFGMSEPRLAVFRQVDQLFGVISFRPAIRLQQIPC